MLRTWNVDDRTVIEARIGVFGGAILSVKGGPIPGKLTTRKKTKFDFNLPDGRNASFSVTPRYGTRPELALSVDGRLMVETGKKPIKCAACGVIVKPNDRFCGACGHEMPAADTYVHRDNLNKATRAITWLAVLFAISGLLM